VGTRSPRIAKEFVADLSFVKTPKHG